jgi:aminomethyltransferase
VVPRRSPLDALHRSLGARMVEFGGFEMPLSYRSGTLAEHMACRRQVAVFDVSHLGTVRLSGREAFARLQASFTNDLARIGPGRAQYTHLLDETDASVLDDLIVWWVDDESFEVMPNASNTARVREAIGGDDVTAERALVAVQGPAARRLLDPLAPVAAGVGRFCVRRFRFEGADCVAAGTGYTGEDGVECAVPVVAAEAFFRALVEAGGTPAGLGARDTLRLEAGLPLHGHELGPGISPLEAGMEWVVAWGKGPFRGREALEERRRLGVRRRLRGLLADTRRPLRAGAPVRRAGTGEPLGEVTSGNFSPVLGRGIGLAMLDASVEEGCRVEVALGGSALGAAVVRPPFVTRGTPAPGLPAPVRR